MRVHMLAVLVIIGLAASFRGAAAEYSHEDHIKEYKGTRTCLKCHREDAESFFHSQHYQWRGEAPGIVNADGRRLGKMNTINDFCTNPSGSQWIGEVRNSAQAYGWEIHWQGVDLGWKWALEIWLTKPE